MARKPTQRSHRVSSHGKHLAAVLDDAELKGALVAQLIGVIKRQILPKDMVWLGILNELKKLPVRSHSTDEENKTTAFSIYVANLLKAKERTFWEGKKRKRQIDSLSREDSDALKPEIQKIIKKHKVQIKNIVGAWEKCRVNLATAMNFIQVNRVSARQKELERLRLGIAATYGHPASSSKEAKERRKKYNREKKVMESLRRHILKVRLETDGGKRVFGSVAKLLRAVATDQWPSGTVVKDDARHPGTGLPNLAGYYDDGVEPYTVKLYGADSTMNLEMEHAIKTLAAQETDQDQIAGLLHTTIRVLELPVGNTHQAKSSLSRAALRERVRRILRPIESPRPV